MNLLLLLEEHKFQSIAEVLGEDLGAEIDVGNMICLIETASNINSVSLKQKSVLREINKEKT